MTLFIYILVALLWWQIVGNKSTVIQAPETVSKAERNLWGSNNVLSILAHLLANFFWMFLIAYPIYWGVKVSILQAITLLIIGNLGAIVIGSIVKKLLLPEIYLVYLGIILCPLLAIVIWFIGV